MGEIGLCEKGETGFWSVIKHTNEKPSQLSGGFLLSSVKCISVTLQDMFNMNQEENPWKTLSSKFIYDNPWIQLTEFDVVNPGGGLGIYGKVHFKNRAVGVMVLDAQNNTYLVGQYRYTLDEYSWEIPEGGGPIGLDPLDSAKRELLEETGLVANHWELLLEMHLSNSVSDELAILYLATELTQLEPEPEETEQLQIIKLPFDEAYQLVMDGKIKDSMSVAAIQKTKLLFLEGKLK